MYNGANSPTAGYLSELLWRDQVWLWHLLLELCIGAVVPILQPRRVDEKADLRFNKS